MCPVVLLSLILSLLLFMTELANALTIQYSPSSSLTIKEDDSGLVNFTLYDQDEALKSKSEFMIYQLDIGDSSIADLVDGQNRTFSIRTDSLKSDNYSSSFSISGKFLGKTIVTIRSKDQNNRGHDDDATREYKSINSLDVIVKRRQTTISLIFTISVATLVSLNYINMGCALEMETVKTTFRRPIAPVLGLLSQYLVMPSVTYLLGYLLLSDWPHLRLGLFVFGCSPAGGASNMWTVLLGGNLDLSVTMTLISTMGAVVMLPLWMYTLGKTIYSGTQTKIPFRNILTTMVSMTICLGIGLLIQRYFPRIAKVCKRILAPVSICMIIFIIIFGTYANLYMFKLMNWRILLSAGFSVWIGFTCGLILSTIARLSTKDRIAISIETGIQNTGTAIVLLGFSLPDPDNDLSAVVPVAASIMTPIPLTIVWISMKVYSRYYKNSSNSGGGRDDTSKNSNSPIDRRTMAGSTATLLPSPVNSASGEVLDQVPKYAAI